MFCNTFPIDHSAICLLNKPVTPYIVWSSGNSATFNSQSLGQGEISTLLCIQDHRVVPGVGMSVSDALCCCTGHILVSFHFGHQIGNSLSSLLSLGLHFGLIFPFLFIFSSFLTQGIEVSCSVLLSCCKLYQVLPRLLISEALQCKHGISDGGHFAANL